MGVMKRIVGRRMFDPRIAGHDSESQAMRKVLQDQNRPVKVQKPPKQERRKNTATALAAMDWTIKEASKLGLDCRHTTDPRGGTLHIMFNHEGRRILDWWPATGTTIASRGARSIASNADQAIKQACLALDRMVDGEILPTEMELAAASAIPHETVTGPEYSSSLNDGTCPFDVD